MLNALRHHRGRHTSSVCGITRLSPVLNALRHHRGRHATYRSRPVRSSYVLNALRHHRGRHELESRTVDANDLLCSTPCGITEVGTARSVPNREPKRLCSTPCGITEVGTASPGAETESPREVLNALRHHRGRHARATSGVRSTDGCSTPCGITEVGTGSLADRVLHQLECSTPCGITEVGTKNTFLPLAEKAPSAQRLAASQRSARLGFMRFPLTLSCSTPCGITEVGTMRRARPKPGPARAQRLAASQRSARTYSRAASSRTGVLNALRHHRGRHSARGSEPRTQRSCAQRLAASQRSAHKPVRDPITALEQCSTPCGITEVGTRSMPARLP